MKEVIEEVHELRRCFAAWTSLPGTQRSGTPALELVEEPLRAFFAKVLPASVRIGKGGRPAENPNYSSDLDIVFDEDRAAWRARFRMDVHIAPVLAHLDVSSRTDWDRGKLEEDLQRAQRTIDDARVIGRKTWTGLAAIGAGFRSRSEDITSVIHEVHHARRIELWESANAGSVWPFIDVIVVPGMFLKKHDLFAAQDDTSERWPVVYPFPVGGPEGLEELWPLVTARAFLASFLRKIMNHEEWDAPAWSSSETSVLMGGAATIDQWRDEWRVISLRHDVPQVLHHWTGIAEDPWQVHIVHDDVTCSAACSYTMLPRSSLSLTPRRREQLLRLCAQDPRWLPIGEMSGAIIVLDFPDSLEHEACRIVADAAALGFKAEAHRRFVKSATAFRDVMTVEIEPTDTVGVDVSGQPFAALRSLLSPVLGHLVGIAPEFQLPMVSAWLDRNRGVDRRSLYRRSLLAKRDGAAIIFRLDDQIGDQPLLLVVLGDKVEQL